MSDETTAPADTAKPKAGARTYNPAANPTGIWWPGVPLADLSAAEWRALPDATQRNLEASGFWTRTADLPDPESTNAPATGQTEGPATAAPQDSTAGSNAVPSPAARGLRGGKE